MESSKLGTDAGECGVGSIVWVRRRNGSWWPGKILEPEELTTSHLTSPRSGAPVKLLGRDDASVDWYNLEKSKRVKAFRCGEFDDCIERAEASLGMPTRKREKYARREDAILHALELEKELLTKQGQLGVFTENQSDSSGLTPNNLLERSGTFFKDNSVRSHLNLQITNDQDQSSFENEDSEVIPRLRGSMDLAVRTAPPKQKHSSPSLSDGFEKPTLDNNHQTPTSNAAGIGSTSPVNGEQTGVFKTKRTAYIYSPAESSEGLDHKEAPPYQTGLSHLQFEDGDCCLRTELSIEESSSGFIEDDETDSSESESESEDHLSETEPDMDEKMTVSGASIHREANYRSRTLVEQATMSSKEYDQSVLSSDISHPHPHDPISPYEAVSKWQLKGKRNIRHLTKDFVDGPDKKGFGGSNHGTYHESGVAAVKQSKLTQKFSFWRKEDFSDAVDVADFGDKDFCTQMIGLDGGYGFRLRAAPVGQNSFSHKIIDWDNMPWEDQPAPRGHWLNNEIHPRGSGRYSTGGRARSVLVDVDLKVQASYKKGLVPIISLLSKVDGKAIIGHPIQIDTLEDGSSENLIPANNYFDNILVNHDRTLPLAWRTVRRSNFCVPRSVLSSFPNGDVAAGSRSVLVQDRRDSKKSRAVGFCYKESKIRKSQSNTMGRRSLKKQQKKVGLSSVQKTRTLSSIAIDHGLRSRALYDTSNGQLIKPVSSGPTTVACIPVKLAFSRLLEKINRPPSKICSNLFISRSDAERNLS